MSADPESFPRRYRCTLCAALLAGFVHLSPAWAGNEGVASGSAVAAIREAGYPCAHVIEMERSVEEVAEDYSAWKVRCNSGSFKVTFEDDKRSEVVPLD